MASFNRVIMMGNLTRDPQLSYLPNQTPVVEFGLASNRKWKGSDGQQKEDTCFVDCRAFGRMAETISKYCQKGRPLLIEGRLTYDQWESQDGQKRSKHRITVENFTFVGSAGGGGAGGGGGGYAQNNAAAPAESDSGAGGPGGDDIPF